VTSSIVTPLEAAAAAATHHNRSDRYLLFAASDSRS